jgi:hypothetical protein
VEAFKNTPTYRLARLEDRFSRLEAEVAALRLTAETQTASALTQLQNDITLLKGKTDLLQTSQESTATAQNITTATLTQLQSDVCVLKGWTGPPIPPGSRGAIFSDFPAIFSEFRGKRFSLLWRGRRDGFGAGEFHSRCDGHANTLTVILDTNGNIFGGFTPVAWDSESYSKADPSLKSFLFTLKNPQNVPPRRFALNPTRNQWAIYCSSQCGPCFGVDIEVSENCNAHANNATSLGNSYTNDTGLDRKPFFTGSTNCQVKEIEVFEITP